MSTLPFSIWFDAAREADDIADALYGGALADAVISERDGTFQAVVERDGVDFAHTVVTAVRELERAGECRVLRVGRDDLVSLAEIGRRVGKSREYIRLLAGGDRGPGGFPGRAPHIAGQDLWSWHEVSTWFAEHGVLEARDAEEATFLRLLNAFLEQRNATQDIADDAAVALVRDAVTSA